jgi:hypothetical protein
MARGRALHRMHCHSCERSSLQTSWDVDNQPAETASSKYFYAALRRLNFLTCVLCLRVVFRLVDLTREHTNGGGRGKEKEKEKALPG